MSQLYLLEVFIESVHFSRTLNPCPKPNDIILTATLNNLISFEIQLDDFQPDEENRPKSSVDFNSGKSCLFPSTPGELKEIFKNNALLILLATVGKSLGVIDIQWTPNFVATIEDCIRNPGRKPPVTIQDKFVLINDNTLEIIGDISAKVQLTCLGGQIQTNYKVLNPDLAKDQQTVLVKTPQGSAVFHTQKYNQNKSGTGFLPIGPLYHPNRIGEQSESEFSQRPIDFSGLSWIALLENQPKCISVPMSSAATFDIVSIIDRPEENKFLNLRIPDDSSNFLLGLQAQTQTSDTVKNRPSDGYQTTIEHINKSLCKNRNCPAAIKFKEFGIGPLATGKGLGTITTNLQPSVKYGISNTYGTFEQYGPYGLLTKTPEEQKESKPLRLTGGGGGRMMEKELCFRECKELINQFDKIVNNFRKCDQTNCTFKIKTTANSGRRSCRSCSYQEQKEQKELPPIHWDCPDPLPKDICKNPECPYLADDLKRLNSTKDRRSECYTPEPSVDICKNPECPYSTKDRRSECYTPEPSVDICRNPECPYSADDSSWLNSTNDRRSECCTGINQSPCYTAQSSINESEISCDVGSSGACTNPICPYVEAKESSSEEMQCQNPDCPSRNLEITAKIPEELQKLLTCNQPNCPFVIRIEANDRKKPVKTPYRASIAADENPSSEIEYTSTTRVDSDEELCRSKCCPKCGYNDANDTKKSKKVKKKTVTKNRRFDYSLGNKYPGIKRGHHHCKPFGSKVPANQGWLWNLYPRKGWRPGAIGKAIAEGIRQYWAKKGIQMLQVKQFYRGGKDSDSNIDIQQKPTLQVQKKDGAYYVTLHPLKDPSKTAPNEDPYINCTPLTFKIIDNLARNNKDKDGGSSDSELDLEFIPNAGILRPEHFKKMRNVVHCDTQYNPKDFEEPKEKKKKKKDKKKDKKGKKKGKKK